MFLEENYSEQDNLQEKNIENSEELITQEENHLKSNNFNLPNQKTQNGQQISQKLKNNEEQYKKRVQQLTQANSSAFQQNTFQQSFHYNAEDQYYRDIDFSSLQQLDSTNNKTIKEVEANVIMVSFDENKCIIGGSESEGDEKLTEEQLKQKQELVLSEDTDEEEEIEKQKNNTQENNNEEVPEDLRILEEIEKQRKKHQEQQQSLQQEQELQEQQSPSKLSAKERTVQRNRSSRRTLRTQQTSSSNNLSGLHSLKELDEKLETEQPSQNEKHNNNQEEEQKQNQQQQQQQNEQQTETSQQQNPPIPRRRFIYARPNPNFQILNMKEFLTTPLPKGYLFQATIRRDRQGMGKFFPKYHVYMSHGFRYLMSCKKRSGNKTSNYLISMDKNKLDKNSEAIIGKVRSNFMGTEFHIYDSGDNPKNCKNIDRVREELAVVLYDNKLSTEKGPTRKMRILLPDINDETNEVSQFKALDQSQSLLGRYKSGSLQNMIYYHNKPPKWNPQIKAYVLNFNGRVDKPSVKNFQLIDYINDDIVYLQFGRVGEDVFNIDAQYPMSPLQAFGICISSFDYKIACE